MGPGWVQLLIVLLIIVLLFGTKKLRNIGTDLGGAIRGFRKAVKDGEAKPDDQAGGPERLEKNAEGEVIEGEVTAKEKDKT